MRCNTCGASSFRPESGEQCSCPAGVSTIPQPSSAHGNPPGATPAGLFVIKSADDYERELDDLAKEYRELRQAAKRDRWAAIKAVKFRNDAEWEFEKDQAKLLLESSRIRLLAIAEQRALLGERRKSLDTLYRMAHKRGVIEAVKADRETVELLTKRNAGRRIQEDGAN